jgi:alpha-tubulin suppressor-like RCC1 family protein
MLTACHAAKILLLSVHPLEHVCQDGMLTLCKRAQNAQVGPEPVQVVGLRWKQVMDVSCGDAHTLACCFDGTVMSWGMGNSGRLGLGHFKSIPNPTKVGIQKVISV